jgi:acetoin utilization deacetylase AcuC-like enzyme
MIGLTTVRMNHAFEHVPGGAVTARHVFVLRRRMRSARQTAAGIARRLIAGEGPGEQRERCCQQNGDQENRFRAAHACHLITVASPGAARSLVRGSTGSLLAFAFGKRSRYAVQIVLPFKLIYHDRYDLHLGTHVFPSQKYRMIRDELLAEGIASTSDFLTPAPATDEDILLVHSRDYVYKLKTGSLTYAEILRMEVPYSRELIDACWLAAGGSILAGRRALEDGWAMNIGGGFHHACPDHGEGFCVIHDVAVAVRHLQFNAVIENAMIVDTDVHQGNGTAEIFGSDGTVFTLSIHQEHNYPYPKPPSTVDVNLPDGIGDEDYLAILEKHLHQAFHNFSPQIVFYVAGADPYCEDQLGGLALTIEGLARRDAMVFDYARRAGVPVAATLAGGYARRVADTVSVHIGTILAARDAAQRGSTGTQPERL